MINRKEYIRIWPTMPDKGVTFEMVKNAHDPIDYENFCKWMNGQTMGAMDDGKSAIYSHDYERWLSQGKRTEQMSHDFD